MKFILDIFVWLTCPIVLAFTSRERDFFDKDSFLRYYQDYNYGLNGDDQWVNPSLSDHPPTKEAARDWKWRVRWCRRNANTYDHEQGVDTRTIVKIEYSGDPGVRNRPSPAKSGELYIKATDKDGKVWECKYTVKQWGNSNRCWRFYRGYKLKDVLEFYLNNNMSLDPKLMDEKNLRRIAAKVFAPNPLMGFDK